ncbi:major tail protein [Microbacterium phage Johann]|uniref:Major tail protein n=2 Tax=Goodmanvirus goodman TaxID=2734238 RepID=A0A3G3LZZ3_9CAUD|nr:major tail protein [Microbacterium phage Goodman]AYQ99473.1 major tail protein [Microbacterium phage Goodman]AYQ99641.1 major tail protein [Microbacterium phage Johann]
MTATTKAPLGASTTNRKWYVDVYPTTEATTPIGVFGIQEFKDNVEPTSQDDSDFDGNGWKSETVTALLGKLEFKVGRKTLPDDPTSYDPGQEVLRKASRKTGVGNRVKVRYYEMEPDGPRVEAYEGFASVGWTPDGGGMDATSTAAVVLTFQGEPKEITHPDADTP